MLKITRLAVVSILGLSVLAGAPLSAMAQSGQDQTITLDMDQADVREALRALFKSTGLSYSVAQDVQGTVSLSLHNVAFATALENILRQVKATYRIEAGVYQIMTREENTVTTADVPEPPQAGKNNTMRRVRVQSGDPMFIATLISKGNTDFKLSPEMSTVIKLGSGGFGNGGFGNNNFGGSNGGVGFGSNWGNGSGFNNGVNGNNGSQGNGTSGIGRNGRGG